MSGKGGRKRAAIQRPIRCRGASVRECLDGLQLRIEHGLCLQRTVLQLVVEPGGVEQLVLRIVRLRDTIRVKDDLIAGLKPVRRASLPKLLGEFDRVWHW